LEKKKKRKIGSKGVILILVIIILIFFALINFITDYLWFKEVGYVSVFFKQLFTQLKIGIPTFIVVTFLAYVYFKFLKKSYYHKVISEDADRGKTINLASWGFAGLFGVIVTYFAVTKLWFDGLKFANSTNFNLKDALFNMDVSFYIFKLDFISGMTNMIIGFLILLLVLTLLYYALLMSLRKPQIFEKVKQDKGNGANFEGKDAFDDTSYAKDREAFHNQNNKFGNGPFADIFGTINEKINGSINRDPNKPRDSNEAKASKQIDEENVKQLFVIAKKQLIIVGIIFFVLLGVHFFLKQYGLLNTHTGAVYGAGYTDVKVTLWVYRILAVLSLFGAVTVAIGISKKKIKPILSIPVIMIVVGILGAGVAVAVQNFVVSPDEINKESKYLERNIECTQEAYNLDKVTVKRFKSDNNLTSTDIANNEPTISNIRINDYKPTKTFYNQTQSIRQYYNFSDVDVDRYNINGEYTQTFLSAREIDESKISETWLNKHLKYTHGYGITMSQVDKITASGKPDMLISDIPPVSTVKGVEITRPEIYFGESTNNYSLVNTDEDEFDYPDGDNNKYTRYEGSAGIKLNPLNRVLFAIKEKSLKLLVSSNINNNSKIVINRNIKKRVEKIMPYLEYDEDPYMCTVDGKLYWIIDAYTTSNKFPYSEPYDSTTSDTNYVRNSVKVVINAYNGDTNYYIVDDTDAIAKTLQNIYPKLFKEKSEMPKGIQEHIRYPNKMFSIQAKVYERYHMNDVKVFYQNEDLWQISNEIYGTDEQKMEPNYYILNLPGEKKEEFVNSIPYTPKDKKNMTGLLMARNDGDNYGKLVLYKFPKSKVTYGPMQVEAQVDQNTEISKEFSLWSQAGSTYSRGNMFVIPIENSILYVEPVYLEATNSSIPEVKRVIVAYGEKIAYKPTLAEALDELFGEGSGNKYTNDADKANAANGSKTLTQSEIIQKVQKAYDSAIAAQEDGDWAKYGEDMDQMEKYLNKLQ